MNTQTEKKPTNGWKAGLKAFAIWLLANVILLTTRIKFLNLQRLESVLAEGKPVLYAFWHGRQLGLFKINPEKRLCVLASLSHDGEIQSRVCRRFGIRIERGSSSRGGLSGLLALKRQIKRGYAIGMAVDGPRGPVYLAKPGIVVLARSCGSPIFPITVGYRRSWVFSRSWDRFVVPRPFTKMTVAVGAPIYVPPTSSSSEILKITDELTAILCSLTEEVDSIG